MEVNSSTNVSQSLALAAYSSQQQQAATRSRDSDRNNESVDANRDTETRRGDNVNFSREALQLSSQGDATTNRNTVNRSNESDATRQQLQQERQAANPEVVRAEGAKSVAQAINAYRDTSVI